MKDKRLKNSGDHINIFSKGGTVICLSAAALCSKAFGFAEKVVIAHFFGTSDAADVYFASIGVVLSAVWVVRELVYPTVLPVFSSCLSKGGMLSSALFRNVFFVTAGFLVLVALLLFIFGKPVADVLVPGFPESKRRITANLLRGLAPTVLFLGLTMVTFTVLSAHRFFLRAALPETALKSFIVVGLLVMVPLLGIYAFAVVVGIGSLGLLAVHLSFIPESRYLFQKKTLTDRADGFREVLLLMGPLAVGVVFSHISALVDNILASMLPAGQLSYLSYSRKAIDALLLIGPVALVTVVYSQLAHFAALKDYEGLRRLAAKAFRVLVYLSFPATCLLIVLKTPIIWFLFQRGRFDAESTLATSRAFMVLAFGLATFSLEALLVHSFFALSDTRTPVKLGVVCVFIDIILALALVRSFQYLGIAAAFVIAKTIKVSILAGILNHRLKGLFDWQTVILISKSIGSTVVVWMVAKLLLEIENPASFFSALLFDLILPASGALAAFALSSYLLRVDEFIEVLSLLGRRKTA